MVEGRLGVGVGRFVLSLYVSMLFYSSVNGGGIEGPRSFGLGGSVWGGGGHWNVAVAVSITAMAGLALAATLVYSRRGSLKSPWSRRRRKHTLSPEQWKNLFSADGKLRDGGVKFLKKVRSGGVDPSIRDEVWPFLLGVYDLDSTREEREAIKMQKRKEYEQFRRKCQQLLMNTDESYKDLKEVAGGSGIGDPDSPSSKNIVGARLSGSIVREHPDAEDQSHSVSDEASHTPISCTEDENKSTVTHCEASQTPNSCLEEENKITVTHLDESAVAEESSDTAITNLDESAAAEESSDTESSVEESESMQMHHAESTKKCDSPKASSKVGMASEDFATWQRIIRLDAVRANAEWVIYSPAQAAVSEDIAQRIAQAVHLKDYDHLEPCRIFHSSRLVAILEAYALYDPEIGYCQGMSDLLSPIIAVIEEDYQAFWCFVGFMRKARHNFRLDEVGIRRQLNIVSKIIKSKDSHLYRHLEKLQAEDCFFVYRMVVVLFRRELSFEQTVCLWEVMWADQAAIRAGIGKSAVWGRMRQRVPPTDDLLLYAIAASVLQKRKLIIEKYSSMDEIIRECNSMAGQLDVWKLLDDAHELVVTVHEKI